MESHELWVHTIACSMDNGVCLLLIVRQDFRDIRHKGSGNDTANK